MRTLVVLCAGNGMLDHKPLYLCRHPNGKLLAEQAVARIFPERYDKIVYVIAPKADAEYYAGDILKREMDKKYPLEVIRLPHETKGPAETLYNAIQSGGGYR